MGAVIPCRIPLPRDTLVRLARQPNIDGETIALLLHEEAGVRSALAANPVCPTHIMRQLATDPDVRVRRAVAAYTRDADTLRRLMSTPRTPETILSNPACSREILGMAAHDSRSNMRWALAEQENCPLDLLEELADDPETQVVKAAYRNPICPPDTRRRIYQKHGDTDTFSSLLSRWTCTPSDVLEELFNKHPQAVTSNPNCPVPVLQRAALTDDAELRAAAAKHHRMPPVELQGLASDPAKKVRLAVAQNPACPQDCLWEFLQDPDPEVRQAAGRQLYEIRFGPLVDIAQDD